MYKPESKISLIYPILPLRIRQAVMNIDRSELKEIQEIRLRRSKPLCVTALGKEYALTTDSRLVNDARAALIVSEEEVTSAYRAALDNSIHSHAADIRQGFITAAGGCRVGFSGTAVTGSEGRGTLLGVKDISSLNIRIAREILGCAEGIYDRFMKDEPASLLIAGTPGSGKTTVLRDLCRLLGQSAKIAVIDERNELAAVKNGCANCDVGLHSDVFTSYSKRDAIEIALRTMSPDVLVCDEIGSKNELEAFALALDSGVKIVASCHASCVSEVRRRPAVSRLIKLGAFDSCAVLGKGSLVGRVVEAAALRKRL